MRKSIAVVVAVLACAAVALAQQVPSLPFSPSAGGSGGLSLSTASSTFLKLDASNDPLTGSLEISTASGTSLWVHDASASAGVAALVIDSGDTGRAAASWGTTTNGEYWILSTPASAGTSGAFYLEDCHATGSGPSGCSTPLSFAAGSGVTPGAVSVGAKILNANGTAALPSYSFSSLTDSGLYAPGTNAVALSAGGVAVLTSTTTQTRAGPNGTAAVPAFSFASDTDNGMYLPGANSLGFSAGGISALVLNSAQAKVGFLGTTGAPAFTFNADDNTGLWSPSADIVALSSGGVERARFGGSEVVINETAASVDFRVEGATESNLLVVDASADRVGVGTASPSVLLHVYKDTNADVRTAIQNPNAGASALAMYELATAGADLEVAAYGSGWSTSATDVRQPNRANIMLTSGNELYFSTLNTSQAIVFNITNALDASAGETLRMTNAAAVFNESGTDRDFRVESDSTTHMLFVDAGANSVAIATSSPTSGVELDVDGEIEVGSGSAAQASIDFADIDTGLYSSAANTVSVTAGGTKRLDVSAAGVVSSVLFSAPDGSTAAPSITFTNDVTSGLLMKAGGDGVDIAAGGALSARVDLEGIEIAIDGTNTATSLSWTGDANTGLAHSADELFLIAGGAYAFSVAENKLQGTNETAATPDVWQPARAVGNTPSNTAQTCNSTNAGALFYWDDTNDGKTGHLCVCIGSDVAVTGTTVYDWVAISGSGVAATGSTAACGNM